MRHESLASEAWNFDPLGPCDRSVWTGEAPLPQLFSVQSLFGCEVGKAHEVACCQKRRVHIHRRKTLVGSALSPKSRTVVLVNTCGCCTTVCRRSTDHAPDDSDTVWIARTPQTPKLAVYQKMSNVLDPNMVSRLAGKRSVLVAENVKNESGHACLSQCQMAEQNSNEDAHEIIMLACMAW